jgi:hypothetical protein
VLYSAVIDVEVIYFIAELTKLYNKLSFYNFHYCTTLVKLTPSNDNKESVYLDTGCTMTLVD